MLTNPFRETMCGWTAVMGCKSELKSDCQTLGNFSSSTMRER